MLKYRLIFGILFGALFLGMIAADSWASRQWPVRPYSCPPGAFVALVCLFVIPFAIREMRALLSRQNVIVSMRITVAAALLCMFWPWVEQVADNVYTWQQALSQPASLEPPDAAATMPAAMRNASGQERARQLAILESSPWYTLGRSFRTVKPHYLVPSILALSLVAAVVMHSRHHRVEGAMANAGATLLAIVYLGVLPGFFLPICMTHSAWMVLAIVAIVKSADIGAYTTGHAIGRHKLIPWLSPGKTVEGFFGGLLFSAIVGAAAALLFPSLGLAWYHGLIGGAILGAVGQIGDLFESLLKRDAGVKDSGTVPGFGGVLDILDSPLLAAPVAYWLLKLVALHH
ncbi:MAG TPA: phosphatidate cytidylyltransferase [Phycisphaerae bacterium]|nr:phosphatidate cytidylyltransferase [Phycisphaerae bacterium]